MSAETDLEGEVHSGVETRRHKQRLVVHRVGRAVRAAEHERDCGFEWEIGEREPAKGVGHQRRIIDRCAAVEHATHENLETPNGLTGGRVGESSTDDPRPRCAGVGIGAQITQRLDPRRSRILPRHALGDLPRLVGAGEIPDICVEARVAAGMVGVDQRRRAIRIECDPADAEHPPRAGKLSREGAPERKSGLRDLVERRATLSQRGYRIERQRFDGHAVPRDRIKRGANSAEEGEALDERGVNGTGVRGNVAPRIEPVGEHDCLCTAAFDPIEAVENRAIDIVARRRFGRDAARDEWDELGVFGCRADRAQVAAVRMDAGVDLFGNSLDYTPRSFRLPQKQSFVHSAVLTAPFVGLNQRFGVSLVESDLRQCDKAPRPRIFPLQLARKSPALLRQVVGHWMRRDVGAPISHHAVNVVHGEENDRNRVAELGDARLPAGEVGVRDDGGSVHLRFVLPGTALTLGEGAWSAHMTVGGVVHDDHRRPLVAILIEEVEHGAIDRRSITYRIRRRLGRGIVPERDFGGSRRGLRADRRCAREQC